jgi:hypothetical protein
MFETTVAAHTTEKTGCSNGAQAEIAGGACALGDDRGETKVFFYSQRAGAMSTPRRAGKCIAGARLH